MRLLAFQESHETVPAIPHIGRRGWRWVLDLSWLSLTLQRQVMFHNTTQPIWRDMGGSYFNMCLTRYFRIGQSHDYYDGPHCSYSLGWLHFNWSHRWCEKCMPPD